MPLAARSVEDTFLIQPSEDDPVDPERALAMTPAMADPVRKYGYDENHRVVVTVVGGRIAFDPQQRGAAS